MFRVKPPIQFIPSYNDIWNTSLTSKGLYKSEDLNKKRLSVDYFLIKGPRIGSFQMVVLLMRYAAENFGFPVWKIIPAKPEVVVQRLEITGGAYKVEALLTNVR